MRCCPQEVIIDFPSQELVVSPTGFEMIVAVITGDRVVVHRADRIPEAGEGVVFSIPYGPDKRSGTCVLPPTGGLCHGPRVIVRWRNRR